MKQDVISPVSLWGLVGDPWVILLVVIFVDWVKKIVTHERRTDGWTDRRDSQNSVVDIQ